MIESPKVDSASCHETTQALPRPYRLSHSSEQMPHASEGTLLWIGDPEDDEFQLSRRYCEKVWGQIAFRHDMDDAVRRPAHWVTRILVTRRDRSVPSLYAWERLGQQHPQTPRMFLEGALCVGESLRRYAQFHASIAYNHQWDAIVPHWLASGTTTLSKANSAAAQESCLAGDFTRPRSVAVIAKDYENGSTLLEVANEAGATTVWIREPSAMLLGNFDVFWWDDSATHGTTYEAWTERLDRIRHRYPAHRQPKHWWITNDRTCDAAGIACRAGIDAIITKPLRIDALLASLASTREATTEKGCAAFCRSTDDELMNARSTPRENASGQSEPNRGTSRVRLVA